jgi:hypothetical protein
VLSRRAEQPTGRGLDGCCGATTLVSAGQNMHAKYDMQGDVGVGFLAVGAAPAGRPADAWRCPWRRFAWRAVTQRTHSPLCVFRRLWPVLPWICPCAQRVPRTYVAGAHGGMAGGSTIVSRAAPLLSDIFPAVPDWLSDIFLRRPGIFMSDAISAAVGSACAPPFVSDIIAGHVPWVSDVQEGVSSWRTDASSVYALFASDTLVDSPFLSGMNVISSPELSSFCQTSFVRVLLSIVSDMISASAIPSRASPCVSDTMCDGTAVRSASSVGAHFDG